MRSLDLQNIDNVIRPNLIEKEEVASLHYPANDVLPTLIDRENRRQSLIRATRAGNLDKVKFKITFEDDKGLKEVHTTIWATTEFNIVLKRGVPLPIRRIYSVRIA